MMSIFRFIWVSSMFGACLCVRVADSSDSYVVHPVAVRIHTPDSVNQYSIWHHPQYDTGFSSRYPFPAAEPNRYGRRPSRELVPISIARLPPRNHQLALAVQRVQPRPHLLSDFENSESSEEAQQDYIGGTHYTDYHDYDDDDDDDDEVEEKVVKKKKKKKLDKFEKIDRFIDKIHNKIYDKYLHIKEKTPPEPPDWAKKQYGYHIPSPDLPPWHKVL